MRLLLVPALLALLPLSALAQGHGQGHGQRQRMMQRPPTVTAEGTGEVSVAPDRAVIGFGVQQQAETAQAAQGQVNGAMNQILSSLRKLGVPANKVRTDRINLYPVYSQQRPGEPNHELKVVGFRAANSLRVELELGAKGPAVGAVLDAAIAAGANSIEGISFEIADDRAHRAKALELAAADAKAKASTIAKALGSSLGSLRQASEGGVSSGPIRPMMMRMEAASGAASTSVEPGEITLSTSVNVVYDLASP